MKQIKWKHHVIIVKSKIYWIWFLWTNTAFYIGNEYWGNMENMLVFGIWNYVIREKCPWNMQELFASVFGIRIVIIETVIPIQEENEQVNVSKSLTYFNWYFGIE